MAAKVSHQNYTNNKIVFDTIVNNYLSDISLTYLDVGARGGMSKILKSLGDSLYFIGFEADKTECERLNNAKKVDKNDIFLSEVLWQDIENKEIYITKDPACSSLFKPNLDLAIRYPYYSNVEINHTENVATTTLDLLKSKNKLLQPDVIKIDVQGAELSILEGGKTLLDDVLAIEVEVEFEEVYKNQPLFYELDSFLKHHGFELMNLNKVYLSENGYSQYFRGRILWGDAVYFKSYSKLINSINKIDTQYLLKVLLVSSYYLNSDFGLNLMKKISSRPDFEESKKIKEISRKIISDLEMTNNNNWYNKILRRMKNRGLETRNETSYNPYHL